MAEEVTEPTNVEEVVPEPAAPEPGETPEAPEPTGEEPANPPEPPAPDPEPDPEPPVSRRESLRIQQLVSKLKQAQGQPAAPAPLPIPTKDDALDYATSLDADPETIKQLEDDRQRYGQRVYQEGIKQAESIQWHTRLEIDAPRIEAKYPQLNKDASEFNPVLSDAISRWYVATAGYDAQTNTVQNANVRYADFVEGIMELADEIAGTKTASAAKNIAKQAASTALRPDGSAVKLNLNQAPENMTDDELQAVIDQAIPRDPRGRFAPRA